jgi:hypothetical protein
LSCTRDIFFYEDGDLLSPWCGYGVGQGDALGFDSETLQAFNSSERLQASNPGEYFPFSETTPVKYGILSLV